MRFWRKFEKNPLVYLIVAPKKIVRAAFWCDGLSLSQR